MLLKMAAIAEFGLPGVAYSRTDYTIAESAISEVQPAIRRLYEDTQRDLRMLYPDGVIRLYRGVRRSYALTGALESWSSDYDTARRFDGAAVIERDIPIERILTYSGGSHWLNGEYGEEYEYVVMAGG